jgi:hypothetical protein
MSLCEYLLDGVSIKKILIVRNREEPTWNAAPGFLALGLLSVTMGLQGIVGKVSPLLPLLLAWDLS